MYVKEITLDGFRNYDRATAHLIPGTNVIIGDNGQGKTNLLEAVYYLTGARSFRTRYDRELIAFDREDAFIDAEVYAHGRTQQIELALRRGRQKRITVGGVRLRGPSELSGRFTAVLFCPEDLSLVREGAAGRRRLMDNAISQLRPKYAGWLSQFNRLYEHKYRILKDFHEKPALLDALDDFNFGLAKAGAQLIYYRAAFVKKLAVSAAEVHWECSGGKEELTLSYRTVKTVTDPTAGPAAIFEALMAHQQSHRQAEIDAGQCLSGAHKDDIDIDIGGMSARSFASQGQTRTAALSVKLAERDMFRDEFDEYPVLLLDDVLSELDAKRQDFVLNRIGEGQVLITCCQDSRMAERTAGRILRIESGTIFQDP